MFRNKITYLFLFFFYSTFSAFAQTEGNSGARSAGMGNASVCLTDVWSNFNNQAGLGFIKQTSVGANYENRFGMKELSTKSVAAATPVKGGVFGVNVSSFGYTLYHENKYGLAFGKSFGEFLSAGIQMDYLSYNIAEGYGNKGFLTAEMGILAKPMKNLIIGAHLFNPTRTKLATYNNEKIPTLMNLGVNYIFSEKVFVAVEIEKDIDHKPSVKVGTEYHPIKEFYLRAGVSSNPSQPAFGFGLDLKNFKLDVSAQFHSVLGFSPQFGLSYRFE